MKAVFRLFNILTMSARAYRQAESGFTLVEALMCLTMLALIMLPFTLAVSSSAQASRSAYLQSTRTIMLNSLKNETRPTDPEYVSNFTDSSMNTSITDSGATMGYRRAVDATTSGATNAMKRTSLFYLYTNSTDASSAARYKTTVVSYPKAIRMHFGTSTGFIDTLGRYWWGNNANYNSGNKIPGLVTVGGYFDYSASDILNTSGNDDMIYEPERLNSSYAADVENGAYTVKLFMCETWNGITATNRRLFNIYIEGIKVNANGPYSPYDATGGLNLAQILMYDVNVSDGTLNVSCSIDSTSNDPNCNFHAIEIIKRSAL